MAPGQTDTRLDEGELDPDPIAQFRVWMRAAEDAGIPVPETVVLATATPEGRPSARVVLLKGADERGFVFFTNRESRKGRELAANPCAALVFHWAPLGRQVRVEGPIEDVTDAEADEYFATRPRGSRIGAWASPQSTVIVGRQALEGRAAEIESRYPGDVPRPPFWGGYRVVPEVVEFWQHGESRLHDRLAYRRDGAAWTVVRLAP